MRISILKDISEKNITKIKEIYAYEEKYGTMNYYSKISSNGIAWSRKDVKLTKNQVNFLIKRGIVEKVREDVYHIVPEIRASLAKELKTVNSEFAVETNPERAIEYAVHSNLDALALRGLLEFQKKWSSMYDDIGWRLSKAKEIIINAGADLTLLSRLRESGLIYQINDDEFLLREFSLALLEPYLIGSLSTQDAVFEYRNVVLPMKHQFERFVNSLGKDDIKDMMAEIRDMRDIVNYSKHVVGSLYLDVLLPIIQQYGMVDMPVYSSEGRKITQTGFSLAYFGEPGTGKTFATDDFLRGNERNGIPPHGIIGKLRYAEGMTPKKFISILEAYQNYPVDWIIPEFNDFFRYRGMVEKLKLVMEQREVSDETKREVIKPYQVKSFFIVNYNTHVRGGKWGVTIDDTNFGAIEDRMICKIFVNSEDREREIYENMVRRISGDIDWYLSKFLRMHVTYFYHQHKKMKNSGKLILKTEDFVDFGNKIREMRKKMNVSVSNRIIMKGVQIAGSAALIRGMDDEITISHGELDLALEFIKEELKTLAKKI